MRLLATYLVLLGSLLLASPALSQSPISEAEFGDIETSCSAEIVAYDRENPNGPGAAESMRSMFANIPNDRASLDSLRDTLGKTTPGILGPTYICALGRRIAQIDGASLLAGPVKSDGEEGPLGLRGKPAPAQTGALAPDDPSPRYWLKGILLGPKDCSFCPRGGVKINVVTSEFGGGGLTGGLFPGDFILGAPMKAGVDWHLKILEITPAGLYECGPMEASGVFGGTEEATNIARATEAVTISCGLTVEGRNLVNTLRSEKEASDKLLYEQLSSEKKASDQLSQAKEAVKDILANAKAGAAAVPMAPVDSGLSARTDAAINAGRSAADSANAAANSQLMETVQSIAQQSMQRQALKSVATSQGSASYPAPFAPPIDGYTPSYSASVDGGSSQLTPPVKVAAVEAHNPANEASKCLELITKSDYERRGVSSIMGAVFRNSCPFSVETKWCIGADRCARGYDNLWTMPASRDYGISYNTPAPGVTVESQWAGCRQGFAYRPDFAGTLHFACK